MILSAARRTQRVRFFVGGIERALEVLAAVVLAAAIETNSLIKLDGRGRTGGALRHLGVDMPNGAVSATALGLALIVGSMPAWGQDQGRLPQGAFRVTWEPQTAGVARRIEGRVQNPSRFRVTNVRLRVEGLDAASEPVGHRFTWAFGDIAPGGEAAFVVGLLVRRRFGGAESVMNGARRGVVNVRPRTGSAYRADAGRWSFAMEGSP